MGNCTAGSGCLVSSAYEDELLRREQRERESGQSVLRDMVSAGVENGSKVDWVAVIAKAEELHRREQALIRRRVKSQRRLYRQRRKQEMRRRKKADAVGSFSVNMLTFKLNGDISGLGPDGSGFFVSRTKPTASDTTASDGSGSGMLSGHSDDLAFGTFLGSIHRATGSSSIGSVSCTKNTVKRSNTHDTHLLAASLSPTEKSLLPPKLIATTDQQLLQQQDEQHHTSTYTSLGTHTKGGADPAFELQLEPSIIINKGKRFSKKTCDSPDHTQGCDKGTTFFAEEKVVYNTQTVNSF